MHKKFKLLNNQANIVNMTSIGWIVAISLPFTKGSPPGPVKHTRCFNKHFYDLKG